MAYYDDSKIFQASQATQIGKEYEDVELTCEAFAIPAPTKVGWSVSGKEGLGLNWKIF